MKILATRVLFFISIFASYGSSHVSAHQGSASLEPRQVCATKALGEACEWSDKHSARYIGTCRKVSASLLCVRNKPIVYLNYKEHKKEHEKEALLENKGSQ